MGILSGLGIIIVENFPEHRKYHAFAWDLGTGRFRYFQFCVLPFGLSSAPFIFTDLDSQTASKILEKSVEAFLIILDNCLGGRIDKVPAKIYGLEVHSDLLKSASSPTNWKSLFGHHFKLIHG